MELVEIGEKLGARGPRVRTEIYFRLDLHDLSSHIIQSKKPSYFSLHLTDSFPQLYHIPTYTYIADPGLANVRPGTRFLHQQYGLAVISGSA